MIVKPSVSAAFVPWSLPFEGDEHCMYLDALGLVTTGMGNLIDPRSLALNLPWKHPDGSLASQDEITTEFYRVKANTSLKWRGAMAARAFTTLRISDADIETLDAAALETDAKILAGYYPDFVNWPADAQLGALSMAWAMGPGFPSFFPSFSRYVRSRDWLGAASECEMDDRGGPIDWRNQATKMAFMLARSAELSGDLDTLQSPVPPLPLLDK